MKAKYKPMKKQGGNRAENTKSCPKCDLSKPDHGEVNSLTRDGIVRYIGDGNSKRLFQDLIRGPEGDFYHGVTMETIRARIEWITEIVTEFGETMGFDDSETHQIVRRLTIPTFD